MRSTTSLRDMTFERPVSGADLVAFQRLVRRVPAAEPVIRYALDIVARQPAEVDDRARLDQEVGGVRRQRPRRAVPRARRQGARADQRPLPRQLRGHPRAGAPGPAPPRADQLPRAVGGRHERRARGPAARGGADAALRDVMAVPSTGAAAHSAGGCRARFVDPVGPRTRRQPRAGRALRGRRVHQRDAPLAVLRRVGRLRRAPRLHPRRRHPPRGLEAVRAHRPLLHQGVRGRHQLQLRRAARRVEVDGVRQPRHHQARLRPDPRRAA